MLSKSAFKRQYRLEFGSPKGGTTWYELYMQYLATGRKLPGEYALWFWRWS